MHAPGIKAERRRSLYRMPLYLHTATNEIEQLPQTSLRQLFNGGRDYPRLSRVPSASLHTLAQPAHCVQEHSSQKDITVKTFAAYIVSFFFAAFHIAGHGRRL